MTDVVDLDEKFACSSQHWSPTAVPIEPQGAVNTGDAGGHLTAMNEHI